MVNARTKNLFLIYGVFVLVFIGGLWAGSDSFTGLMTKNSVVEEGPKNLGDYVFDYLMIDTIRFVPKKYDCVKAAEQLIGEVFNLLPEKVESYKVNNGEGFNNMAFESNYEAGKLKLVRGSSFLNLPGDLPAEINGNIQKIIFAKYSDLSFKISLEFILSGEIEGNEFIVRNGSLASENYKCVFG